jgi:hypothetical protein
MTTMQHPIGLYHTYKIASPDMGSVAWFVVCAWLPSLTALLTALDFPGSRWGFFFKTRCAFVVLKCMVRRFDGCFVSVALCF